MSPVQSKRHMGRDDLVIKSRKADEEKDIILREHDALRRGMDGLLKKTTGLWEENLTLRNELEFWKEEWPGTSGLRSKDIAFINELEMWKTESRRIASVQAENDFLKKQVEQLNSVSKMAEQARKELEEKVARLLRTAKFGVEGSNQVRVDTTERSLLKEKRERTEAEQERSSHEKVKLQRKVREGLRKPWEVQKQRIEKVLSRKAVEDLGKAREHMKQQKATDLLKAKKKVWEEDSKRKMDSTSGRNLKRKDWRSHQEEEKGLNDEDSIGIAYQHSYQGELHKGKWPSKVPFRSQSMHNGCYQIPQQRVFCPTPSEPSTSSSESDSEEGEADIVVPDADFHDFDHSRTEERIRPGQIWAVYDDQDGMPRLYVRISKVTTNPFRARIQWLDERATDEQTTWMKSTGRSIVCGDFKMCRSIRTMDRINPFSHFVMDKVAKGLQKIYPRKGQVWAVYKDPEQEILEPGGGSRSQWIAKTLRYEMVEILGEFCDTDGVKTRKLVQVKGFSSVFHRDNGIKSFRVFQSQEMVKFSHGVPMHRFKDSEADAQGFPRGSVELDPASTP